MARLNSILCAQCLSLVLLLSFNFAAIASARAFVAQITATGSALSPLYIASNWSIGTPPQAQKLLISTDALSHSWVTCGASGASFNPRRSSTFRYLSCGRKPCYETLKPYTASVGRLATDTFSLHLTNGSSQLGFVAVPKVTFACAAARSVAALGFTGVASLTAGSRGLPAQLGVSKFAYCLPMGLNNVFPTPLFLGSGIDYLFLTPPVLINISSSLGRASLQIDARTGLMSVGLVNVTIDLQATVSLKTPVELQMSSVVPFTRLPRAVYVPMRQVFREKAAARGIQRVAGQAGFDTCFNASTVGFSRVGPAVPWISLGLAVEGAQPEQLSVFGFNSVVSVSDSVLCWAFLQAGPGLPPVYGAFQQQGGLFEFDLRNRTLGFSGVLDFFRVTCADFVF